MIAVDRETRETKVRIRVKLGTGVASIVTTVPFLDHMLTALARYSNLDIEIRAGGDLRHHIVEDVAIALGAAIAKLATPTISRYGERTVPMDDALVHAVLDLGGRPYYQGPLPKNLYDHFMRSFAFNAKATLHLAILRGHDRHHIVEAAFKAVGFALRDALRDAGDVQSTKGTECLHVD
jgi:imidazoleglycerol-phosphate dehydratase